MKKTVGASGARRAIGVELSMGEYGERAFPCSFSSSHAEASDGGAGDLPRQVGQRVGDRRCSTLVAFVDGMVASAVAFAIIAFTTSAIAFRFIPNASEALDEAE